MSDFQKFVEKTQLPKDSGVKIFGMTVPQMDQSLNEDCEALIADLNANNTDFHDKFEKALAEEKSKVEKSQDEKPSEGQIIETAGQRVLREEMQRVEKEMTDPIRALLTLAKEMKRGDGDSKKGKEV